MFEKKTSAPKASNRFFAPLHVLIVDDMPVIRRMLSQMLQALGVRRQAHECADGLEAWEALQERVYDLVICDINMPNMSGLELLRRFRADSQYESTPFLMITGEVTEEIVAAAAESEVDGYLLKPFKISALESRLRAIIQNKYQPGSGEFIFLKARKLAAGNRPQEALFLLAKLVQPPFKRQAKILNLMGECHLALLAYEEAAACFAQALELNPQYLKSYLNLASVSKRQGNLAEARRLLEEACKLSPLNGERLFRLGEICLETGEQELARQYLHESLKRGPAIREVESLEIAEVFLQAGLPQVAEDLFARSIQDQPANVHLYDRLGNALRRQNKHQEALRCYQTALDLAPANEKIYFNLGLLYFDLGNKDKAIQAMQTALRLRPDFPEAQEFLQRRLSQPHAPGGLDIDVS
jgi:two-component system chemotaxis response regulator CheY